MSNGQGCTCNAWAANECACGADWTPQEVYDLRAENNRLKAENKLYAAEMSAAKENGFYSAQELFMAYQNAEEELAEAKKDAERYRWLRNQNELLENNTFYVGIDNSEEPGDINWVGVDLDSAIDAAMEGK